MTTEKFSFLGSLLQLLWMVIIWIEQDTLRPINILSACLNSVILFQWYSGKQKFTALVQPLSELIDLETSTIRNWPGTLNMVSFNFSVAAINYDNLTSNNMWMYACRETPMGGICRQRPLYCYPGAFRMTWLAALHDGPHWRRGKSICDWCYPLFVSFMRLWLRQLCFLLPLPCTLL